MKKARFISIAGSIIILTSLLSSCAWLPPKNDVANSSTDYNLAVEKVQNEMLLLNIVRASKRNPMYFTGLSILRGNMTYNFQTGALTVPFGKIGTGFNGSYSIAPNIAYTTQPSFDIGILDNKEFVQGIMKPVTMDTVNYYWQQGWPKEMLLHLFIERIETADGKTKFENYPENDKGFEDFQKTLREIFLTDNDPNKPKCDIVTEETYTDVGPKVKPTPDALLKELVQIQKEKLALTLEPTNDTYQLKSKISNYYFRCEDKKDMSNEDHRQYIGIMNAGSGQAISKNKVKYKIYLRSTEAILYYLGEIVRVENHDITKLENRRLPQIYICKSSEPVALFEVIKSPKGQKSIVSVDYEGDKYIIPRNPQDDKTPCTVDRSMHVMSLISLLIAQQKTAESIPITPTVNVIGK